MGVMDGLGSTAALILGVQGADGGQAVSLLAGTLAGVSGALSMGVSEYVSVSSQRDAQQADIAAEASEQEKGPAARARELTELAGIYEQRGVDHDTALQVAVQLSQRNVVDAHARDEHLIDPEKLVSPSMAAISGCCSFLLGAAIPVLSTAFLSSAKARAISCVVVTLMSFAMAGAIAAKLGGAIPWVVSGRLLVGGAVELGVTFGIGVALGGLQH